MLGALYNDVYNPMSKITQIEVKFNFAGQVETARKRLNVIALERGRPVLLSVRVPDTIETCAAIGIDIERWAQPLKTITISFKTKLAVWRETVLASPWLVHQSSCC